MKKRYLPLVLIAALTLTACGRDAEVATEAPDKITTEEEKVVHDFTSKDPEEAFASYVSDPENQSDEASDAGYEIGENVVDGKYVFNSHVFSVNDTAAWGTNGRDALFNLCDALRKGEDTFECANEQAYSNAIGGRLINYYFPAASNCVKEVEADGFADGVGKIEYLIPKEDFIEREKAFEEKIVKILNDNVKPDYSDFEKALALYVYISQNFTYDQEMSDNLGPEVSGDITTYRPLVEEQGICQELSGLYSYLLMQCGVQADVVCGDEAGHIGPGHQWDFVRINGTDYYVDPTFALHEPLSFDDHTPLDYFLMTDEVRSAFGNFDPATYQMCGQGEESRSYYDIYAKDDSFKELRNGYFLEMDTDANIVKYCEYDTDEIKEFHYED